MKKILFTTCVGLMGLNVNAENLVKNEVVVEHTTLVGFAPTEYRGTYKFQLLSNGVIRSIDNHNKSTLIATLPKESVEKFKFAIEQIRNIELVEQEGPRCMDVPMQNLQVHKSDGTTMTIWKHADCRNAEPTDAAANDVARLFIDLKKIFLDIDNLGK